MPRYELPGQQGRKGNYRRRLRRPTVGVVPALLLFYSQREYGERKSHISTPSDMLRSRAFLKIRFTYSIAGNIRRQGRSMTVRTFRLPLTLFNTFNIFPRTGFGPLSPIIRSIGNSGGEPFPVRFFLYSLTRRNARLSSKRTGTSPTVTRRRIPPRNIRNHSLYLSGTAICGAINAYDCSAAEGLVKLARLCITPRRDRSAAPDFTSYCNFSAENRVNNKDKGRMRPAAVLYREGTLRRSAGPYFGENDRATPT